MNWFYRGNPTCAHPHAGDGSQPPVVIARELTVRYPEMTKAVLAGVACEFQPGSHTALVGPNGAGKSTFLKAIAGLLKPISGTLTVFECPAHHCHPYTCYLPQRSQIDWNFPSTVRDLVLTGAYVHLGWFRHPGKAEGQRVDEALDQLQLTSLAGRQIAQLSGGQQQRALLARAWVHDARLYLLDEPFSGIDTETVQVMSRVMNRLVKEGKTLITSLHAWEDLPLEIDQVIHLDDGRLISVENPQPGPA